MSDIINKTARASSRFFIINLFNRGLGFVFIIIVSRTISQEEFGIFVLALSIAGIFQIIGGFGLPITIQKFLPLDKDNDYIG